MNQLAPSEPRNRFARVLFDYNPFYLLSAMCMLFGLFSLNDSLDWSPIPTYNLLWLILLLNVYEITLIALGIFLARRGLMRDVGTLFILEAFFVVDAGFLNAEIFNFDFELGLAINIALYLLAFVKVGAVFRGLRIPISDQRYPLILAQMMLLFTIPGVLKQASDHSSAELSARAMYGLWWAVGIIPIVYLILMKDRTPAQHRGIVGTFVLLPAVSILAHLCTANWVYNIRWQSANLSPMLLGLAVAAGASDYHVRNVAARMRLQLCLPVLAILLASSNPFLLTVSYDEFTMTTLRFTLVAAALVYVHGIVVHRHPYFGLAGMLCIGGAGFGDSPVSMMRNISTLLSSIGQWLWRRVPRTLSHWGIVSVVSSFVLLGLGLVVSLIRPQKPVTIPVEPEGDST